MGSCCSKSDDVSQTGNLDERKRLLENPVSDISAGKHYGSNAENNTNNQNKSEMEDEKFGRIMRRIEVDVIDVPSLKISQENRDFTEKSDKYSQKLNSLTFTGSSRKCILEDVSAPEEILSKSPVSVKDKELINDCSEKILNALKDIKVTHTEELVVPFVVA